MQFRLTEGGGECRYLVGVNDNGTYYGLEKDTLNETIQVINTMAQSLNAETTVLRSRQIGDKMACEARLSRFRDRSFLDLLQNK